MVRRRWVHAALASALLPPLFVLASASSGAAAPVPEENGFKAVESLKAVKQTSAAKSPTSRMAKTDPSLLNRSDTAKVSIAVKLDYDSTATYSGDIAGYAATSPSVTGKALSGNADEKRYENRIAGIEDKFLTELKKQVPDAKVGQKLRTVYGGVALTVPANKIGAILAIDNVVAVQADTARQPQTDSSPAFIGADKVYPQLGGAPNAGKGVIFGSIDSGVWPEHPSFADNGNLGAPPAKADGTPRACNFGDNPLTPAADPFVCNKKLIGGQGFLDTYNALQPMEVYGYTARDSDGHGTHTASTAAGDPVASAKIFDIERGPINGIAPGAWVSVYKVCGATGCYSSDSAAAVAQAIKDGVNVINFSISGGASPYTDIVELAFFDAYKAGVFVAASAGNSGPGASTSDHLSPWVTTVAASTQTRAFQSTITLKSSDGSGATLTGTSITPGIAAQTPVVLASAAPYSDPLCIKPVPAGLFNGKIVACKRGPNRVLKGVTVKAGGAVGMILYNDPAAETLSDSHWLPAVHLADGKPFLNYVGAHPNVTASFTQGVKATQQGDVMASFSSRGPGGNFIKPDITAPGTQILAGNTPTPDDVAVGPPGQYFQAIAGTSMSSPHIAGSAILEKALNPAFTPGQIKSAMMTTATTKVLKEDGVTPADPFDLGAGRVQVNLAATPGLTFDETADRMFALGNDPVNAVQINLPSVNAPVMPGKLTAVRTAKNVTNKTLVYRVETTSPSGSSITATPALFSVAPGKSQQVSITIKSNATQGQYFGEVRLVPVTGGVPTLHLPVAFVPKQGDVKVTQTCTPTQIGLLQTSKCTVTATNGTFNDTTADFTTTTSLNLPVAGATGASVVNPFKVEKKGAALAGAVPGTPSLTPGTIAGYLPLSAFGISPTAIGDEDLTTFNVPAFIYNGITYTSITVDSNGYLYPGSDDARENNNCCSITPIPDPAKPNNVLAPFWTDLNGTGRNGLYVGVLTDGVDSWVVAEWDVVDFGTTNARHFQVWLGTNGVQDIVFAYDPASITTLPAGQDMVVGAENLNGTGGQGLPVNTLPTEDLRVVSTDPVPGASVSYTVTVFGLLPGNGEVTSSVSSPAVPGTTVVKSTITVSNKLNHIGT
ncbi:S8 family serine peptidase [Dactylosporangium matsuzakiense]|uniref:S8 family serine peptidase n=1 Tax=Dactylosporangium matsuzakiense TaxID=53360 RepID=UPI0021C34373|nr:S8 family serine peptidase [Dactylosporangium matsuzakiense]UWZ44844.1 S8 family serine peptidase [Dactylosporangium matsuzakiense]